MIHLYTGEGKGKTTAAIGLAVRGAGSGLKVLFTQFMKGNDSGELHVLEKVAGITICRSRREFGFYRTLTQEDKKELAAEHDRILDEILRSVESGGCDMVIMDEITYPVNWKLLDPEKLRGILKAGRGEEGRVEVVLTGRDPAVLLMDDADYVTEMKALRHPYQKGIAARKGIEY